MTEKYVVYYRVSTSKQEKSGLGLEAQRSIVEKYLKGNGHQIVGEYIETMSGGNNDRPQLQRAMNDCKLKDARLIVSKLDRLSRDIHFITGLQKAGVRFVVAEQPEMTELTVNLLASVAQHERQLISQRTRDALAAAKQRGAKLGNPCLYTGNQIPGSGDTTKANQARLKKSEEFARLICVRIKELQEDGITSLLEIASRLNSEGYRTARSGHWHAMSVKRVLERVAPKEKNECSKGELVVAQELASRFIKKFRPMALEMYQAIIQVKPSTYAAIADLAREHTSHTRYAISYLMNKRIMPGLLDAGLIEWGGDQDDPVKWR